MKIRRIMLDADDVIVDFTNHVLNLINQKFGLSLQKHDRKSFELADAFNMPMLDDLWREAVEAGGFVSSMLEIEGSRNGIEQLRANGFDVFALTSTPLLRNWHFERSNWLIEHVGIKYEHQVHTPAKYGYNCGFFVDDKLENLEHHALEHPETVHVILDQPWNRKMTNEKFVRALDWKQIVDIVTQW